MMIWNILIFYYLQEDANIVLVDWQKGAAGPSYISAAANTQLVGRQLALLLMDMMSMGLDPSHVHIIGFSLGAHIAGYAGRSIQKKKQKVGRITGEKICLICYLIDKNK